MLPRENPSATTYYHLQALDWSEDSIEAFEEAKTALQPFMHEDWWPKANGTVPAATSRICGDFVAEETLDSILQNRRVLLAISFGDCPVQLVIGGSYPAKFTPKLASHPEAMADTILRLTRSNSVLSTNALTKIRDQETWAPLKN